MPRSRDTAVRIQEVDPADLLTDDVAVEFARIIARIAARQHHEAEERRRRDAARPCER